MANRGFARLGTSETDEPQVSTVRDPEPPSSTRCLIASSGEGSEQGCRKSGVIVSVLCLAVAGLLFAGWRFVGLPWQANKDVGNGSEPERKASSTKYQHGLFSPAHPIDVASGVDAGMVKLWKEPPSKEWPLRPVVIKNVGPKEKKEQKCLWLSHYNLAGSIPRDCAEDDVYSSFAWFPETGKMTMYWYKQCLTAQAVASVEERRPAYCEDLDQHNGRRLRNGTNGSTAEIPPECLEKTRQIVPIKNGNGVWLNDCKPNDPWQEWHYDRETMLFRNKKARTCLSYRDTIHLWECLPESPHQQWKFVETWEDRAELKKALPPKPELPRNAAPRTLVLTDHDEHSPKHSPVNALCPEVNSSTLKQKLTYDPVQKLPTLSPAEQAHIESLQDIDVLWDKNTSSYGVEIGGSHPWIRSVVTKSKHSCIREGDVILAVNGRPAATGVHVRELIERQGQEPLRLRVHRRKWMEERLSFLEKEHEKHGKQQEGIKDYNKIARHGEDHVPHEDVWNELRHFIHREMGDRAVYSIGNEEGVLFRYNPAKLDESITIASEFKLMGATLIMRLIELGYFGLDDRLSHWLPWWPTDPTDSRSYITVRHCIAMTSGFYWIRDDRFNVKMDGRPERFNDNFTNSKYHTSEKRCREENEILCAQHVLKTSQHIAPPGVIWTYSGDHLHLVAAVMVTATGSDYADLWPRHVFHRTSPHMKNTRHYLDLKFWDPAAEVRSTPRDLQAFLSAYFNQRLISESSQRALETESVREARVRWFFGGSRPARPHGLPNFAFDVWISNPAMYKAQVKEGKESWCGLGQNCIFAPSYFNSVLVVERLDWTSFNKRSCTWKYSKTCAFYFHLQNVVEDPSQKNNERCRYVSHTAEDAAFNILQGKPWKAPPIRYTY